jgi:hypothetical protein
MQLKLLQTHTITFVRTGSDTDKPYVNEYGESVTPTTETSIVTQGSLQPRSKANNRQPLPEGFREQDFLSYYTTTDLRTTEQVGNNLADKCEIKGKWYRVTREGYWSDYGLSPDHKEYFLQLIQPLGS